MISSFEGKTRGFAGATGAKDSLLREFTSAETWQVLSGLSSPKTARVILDARDMTGGELALEVDGTVVEQVRAGERDSFVVRPSTSLNVISRRSQGVYDVSNASLIQSEDLSAAADPRGMSWRPDGSRLLVGDNAASEIVEFNFSTPWDLSTASLGNAFDTSTQDTNIRGPYVKPDGTQMFIAGANSASAYRYALSTAWDVTSASLAQSSGLYNTGDPDGIAFTDVNGQIFIIADGPGEKLKFDSSPPWRLDNESADFASEELHPIGQVVRSPVYADNDNVLYAIGTLAQGGDPDLPFVYQFRVPNADGSPINIHIDSRFDLSGDVGNINVHAVDVRDGGDEIYVADQNGIVYRYDLTTAFAGSGLASVAHN